MLGLFGKKSDHPMADVKSAQLLLADLPKDDALKALHELAGWIESVRADTDIRLDERFGVLRLLDETARPYETRLRREYFSPENLAASAREKRLWRELTEFYTALAAAYYSVLVGCHNGEKGAAALKTLRPLIVARGVSAVAEQLKCTAAHYAPVAPEVWTQLADYYADAEVQDFLDDDIELYAGLPGQSIRRQLAGILLWWGSGTGTLKPDQIHLSERLTAAVCGGLSLGAAPADDTLFVFDLSQANPPARYNGDTSAHPNLRFVGLGEGLSQLEGMISRLEKGVLPPELGLGGPYPTEPVLDMARRLASGWQSAPPSRRNIRHSISVNLAILKGMSEVLAVAAGAAVADSGPGKTWVAEDISATGFRCNLDVAQATGIAVGSLVGFRPQNVQHWGIGIVRRLRRGDQNKMDAGIEVLTNRMTGVGVREEGGPEGANDLLAIWLGQTDGAGRARLLVKAGSVAEDRLLRMRAGGKRYMLMPHGAVEKGDDFDLLRYQAVEQTAD